MKQWISNRDLRPTIVMTIGALVLAVQVGPWWYASIDSASYLSIARSLVDGGAGPTNLGSALLWYAPGYPALISPLFLISDRPFLAISLVQWVLAVGLMLGVYRWIKQFAPQAAVWIAALTVINHGLWIHFRRPLSEVAFMCAFIWAVNCLNELGSGSRTLHFKVRLFAAAALTAVLCIIRPVGVMLAPAVVVWSLLRARSGAMTWRRTTLTTIAIFCAASLPVTAFVIHERIMAARLKGRSYLDEFHEAAQSPLESYSRGLQLTVSDIGRVCIPGFFKSHGTPGDWTDINMLVHLPFALFVAWGWLTWVRRHNDLFALFVPFYLLLIAAHAVDTGARLLLPLLPALFVAAWFAAERLGRRRLYVVWGCLLLQLLVAGSYWLGVDLPRARRYDRLWPPVDAVANRIATDPGPVDAYDLPGELQLMLEVALDRPVVPKGEQTAAWWSVTLREERRPDGFVLAHEANELLLWRRESATIASR